MRRASSLLLALSVPCWLAACVGQIDATHGDDDGSGAADAASRPAVDATSPEVGFGYPVGDRTSYPAGGWAVIQVLAHYFPSWGGRHLAVDLMATNGAGEVAAELGIDAPVYAVGDGEVLYAGPNGSTYRHVVLIRHQLDDGSVICSFYGHVGEPLVATGDRVSRGQQITTVLDWAIAGGGPSSNTHLHYVMLSEALCTASANAGGTLVCGYDDAGAGGAQTLADEPYSYTSGGDVCGTEAFVDAFVSPTQFIAAHAVGG